MKINKKFKSVIIKKNFWSEWEVTCTTRRSII